MLASTTVLFAQSPEPGLQDLVGAKGSGGETELENRGYAHVRTTKDDSSAYSFWIHQRTGHCVQVRTTNGRYASIVASPQADCQGGASSQAANVEFETICGVTTQGKTYRYKCHVEEVRPAPDKHTTVLTFPDQVIRLHWHDSHHVGVQLEGMKVEQSQASTSEGETSFTASDNTYFYISNPEAARREVQSFRGN